MKLCIAVVVALLSACVPVYAEQPPTCKGGDAKMEKDRFTGTVTLSTEVPVSIWKKGPTPLLTYVEKHVALSLVTTAKTWQYLDCHSVDLLIDGKRAEIEEPHRQGRVYGEGVGESFTMIVPADLVERIAQAKLVEYRICRDEFKMSEGFLCAARKFLYQLRQLEASQN